MKKAFKRAKSFLETDNSFSLSKAGLHPQPDLTISQKVPDDVTPAKAGVQNPLI